MEELEPAREQVNFVWLAILGVVLAAALGAGAVWIKRVVSRRIVPLSMAGADDADAEAEAAVEVAMMVADHTSRLPANVRRTIREGTHADLEKLCRPGATVLLESPEEAQEESEEDAEMLEEMLELQARIEMLDDDDLLGEEEQAEHGRSQFGDPLLRSKLATSYLLKPGDAADTAPKADPGSVVELHLGLLRAVELERLQNSIHGLGGGMDVLIEGPLLKLTTIASIQCWNATYVRVWADGRWIEIDDFVKTDEQPAPELDAVPTNVTTVFEVVHGPELHSIPAATESEPHDAVLTVRTGKRGTSTQVYCATDAAQAEKWVSGCKTLAKTSILPQPALIHFLEERSLGDFAAKLAELAKVRTVDQLAITPVSDTTLVLVGMNRFKQRIYRRAVREAYKQQSAAAAKSAAADIPTLYEKTEEEKRRHEDQKKKIKVTEKARAKKRKEEVEAAEAQTLDAMGARLIFDVEPMDVVELRKLMGDSDAKIKAEFEARERDKQRAAEKAEQHARLADSGTLLQGWACESCMHFNQDPSVKVCGGCSAPAHLVGGPNMTSKKDASGEQRPTTPGGTIITKAQGSVIQAVNLTDDEIAAAKNAHEERERAEAERRELGGGRGATPERLTRNLNLDTATMITELEARQGRVNKEMVKKRQQALEQAAAARAARLTALEAGPVPHSPRRLEPSRSPSARLVRWVKSVWNTVPWVLRLRRRVPLTAPHLPGTAAFGSVRHSKYIEAKKSQKTKKQPTTDSTAAVGVAGPRAAHAWDSDSEDENGSDHSGSDSKPSKYGGVYCSDEDSADPDDWWYHYMLKHGTDKIMRRK